MANATNQTKIVVDIKKEIWAKDDYIVYIGEIESKHFGVDEIAVNTSGFELRPGKTTLVGTMRTYKGKPSFKCDYEEFDSTSYDSKYNLLCSIKGIKDVTAKKILDNIPDADIEIFYGKDIPKIKGVGEKTISLIHEGLTFLRSNQTLQSLIALIGNSISNKRIHKLNTVLMDENISVDEFKADPYSLLIDHLEIAFKKADFIAQEKLKCSKNLKSRLIFLYEQVVKMITGFGDTYADISDFKQKLDKYNLQYDDLNDLINDEHSKIVNDNGRVQTKLMAMSESEIPAYLSEIAESNKVSDWELSNLGILINEYEAKNKISLHEVQKQAVKSAIENNVNMICGGAGTGKTTIIKCIIYVLKKLNYQTLCTAPTGKASRRMSEATENDAFTCHRFYFAEESGSQACDAWGGNNTVMIIDEFSMVDSILFYKVLQSMKMSGTKFTKILMVGDPGQLASVGAGNVMADLIASGKISVIELTNTFRQSEGSKIIEISKLVRKNETFDLIKAKDFFATIQTNPDDYILRCWIAKQNKSNYIDGLYNDFQICTSSRKRCNEINTVIRAEMGNQPIMLFDRDVGFSLGDKVMNTKNDYDNDIYNGEFGRIHCLRYEINGCQYCIKTNDELKKYYDNKIIGKNVVFSVFYSGINKYVFYDLSSFDELENFQLSYCCTIHKLQGSEFETVICDVSEFNMITDSRLLYTAITRAKKQFILISNEKSTIDKIVKNKMSSKRKTILVEKMLKRR
jgi:exodeoxyribonuclease V alpha subunit